MINENVNKLFELFKNLQILSILESKNNFIVSVCDKNADVYSVTESLYAVDKKTFKISEFSYFNNPDEYTEACKNVRYKYDSDDELTHWGIKGMRWGVRRYQNKDGSLTAAGKRRLKAESESIKKEEQVLKNRKSTMAKFTRLANKRKALEDQKKELDETGAKTKKSKTAADSAKVTQKSVKDMSDAELNAAINRARLEDTYRQLRPEPVTDKHPLMKKMINEVIVPAAVNSGRKFLENALTKAGENVLKGKTDSNSIEALTKVRDKLKLVNEIDKLRKGKTDDDGMTWDEKLKKQQYERNQKKYAEEDAAKNQSSNKTDTGDTSSGGKKTKRSDTASTTKTDEPETVFGEFVGGGNTRQKASTSTKKTAHDIIDAEFEEVTTSDVRNYPVTYQGRSYVSGLLTTSNLPARRDDDRWH